MKNIVRQLNYYGFDDDNTMYKAFKSDSMGVFAISKIKEQKNKKYMRKSEEE
jgi:ABC-type oligopeptide transport system substrate-binding subunit